MKADELKQIVKDKYGKIAEQSDPASGCCDTASCCGTSVIYTVFSENYKEKEGYNQDADLNLGCGIPTEFAGINKGDHVLDLGSGAGNDCFIARAITGETGKVTGLDMTEQMIAKARSNAAKLNYKNVEFVPGDIENMPFDANQFDVVISNCVLNLVPDKNRAFSEIFRVLKPGGHFSVSDIVLKGRLPGKMQQDAAMYAGCVSGAIEMNDYLDIISAAGFTGCKVHKQKLISLPDSLLSEFIEPEEINTFKAGDKGIFSITVSAVKPSEKFF